MSLKLCKLYISRLMALLLCLTLLLTLAPAVSAEEGSCGPALNWSYSDGVLTITGSGEMTNYSAAAEVPWYGYRHSITRVLLPAGMTSVGGHAFYNLTELTTLDLPDGVRSIGQYAFAGCEQMQLLDLGSSLETIGTGAFYSCRSIVSLRFPATLKNIGSEAFYDCVGITSLTLPGAVTKVGAAAFAYCTSLIRVEVQSNLTSLPQWAFFGCSSLTSVTLPGSVTSADSTAFGECDNLSSINRGGDTVDKASLQQTLEPPRVPQTDNGSTSSATGAEHPDGNAEVQDSTVEPPRVPQTDNGSASSATGVEHPDGSVEVQDSTVVENDNSTVSTTTEFNKTEDQVTVSTDVTVTIENDNGWQEVLPSIQDILNEIIANEDGNIVVGDNTVTVYIKDAETVDQTFLDAIAGMDVTVTFISQDGSVWQIRGTDLVAGSNTANYDMRYQIQPGSEELCQKIGVAYCYVLTFRESGQVNSEVMVRLTKDLAMQHATLLQDGEEMKRVQTSVIDADGYAHFYLGAVDKTIEYYIAINLPVPEGQTAQEAIVPEPVLPAYGNAVNYQPIQYEITGRKSSWNMGLGKVMSILAVVMVVTISVVGIAMYIYNKRRLKSGYVPQWEDDE